MISERFSLFYIYCLYIHTLSDIHTHVRTYRTSFEVWLKKVCAVKSVISGGGMVVIHHAFHLVVAIYRGLSGLDLVLDGLLNLPAGHHHVDVVDVVDVPIGIYFKLTH